LLVVVQENDAVYKVGDRIRVLRDSQGTTACGNNWTCREPKILAFYGTLNTRNHRDPQGGYHVCSRNCLATIAAGHAT